LLFAQRQPYASHLSRLALADLFLDSFPFNGGSTVSDALWSGVPVITMSGEAFAARMAGSLLTALALPQLIARDETDYCRLAIELGHSPAQRARLRAQLREGPEREQLFDARRCCAQLEAAYLAIWQRHRDGKPPNDLAIELAHA
jgi:predicted O-linked N-acetylglucosamine transferase (SPINDLY family)